jgi:uncharacterized protein (DUF736 family)
VAYDNKNKGAAFFNDKKADERHPDYRGNGNFNGTDFEFGMWARTSKDGKEYFSISFSEPYKKTEGNSWEAQRQKFDAKKDVALEEVSDDPIDLSEIPFK